MRPSCAPFLLGFVWLAAIDGVSEVHASAPLRVVILSSDAPPDDARAAIERRLDDELTAAGFHPSRVPAPGALTAREPEMLAEIAAAEGAAGAVRVWTEGRRGAEVWMRDPRSGESIYTALDSPAYEGEDGASILILRVVEILYAGLVQLRTAERAPPSLIAPAPPPPRPLGALRLGVFASWIGRELGPSFGPAAGASLVLLPRVSVMVDLAVAAHRISVARPEGRAEVGLGQIRVALAYEVLARHAFTLGLALGGGALLAWAHAEGQGVYVGTRDRTFTGRLDGSIFLRFHLGARFWLRTELLAGVVLPALSLAVEGDPSVSPNVFVSMGTLSLEWSWFR